MRLFIAILLSQKMKTALIEAQNAMYDRGLRGNYSQEENLHLTLAFIGDFPAPEPVLDALETVAFRPFSLSLEGIGHFGDLWWAGLRDSAALNAVARRVRRAMAGKNIPSRPSAKGVKLTALRASSTGSAAGKSPMKASVRWRFSSGL